MLNHTLPAEPPDHESPFKQAIKRSTIWMIVLRRMLGKGRLSERKSRQEKAAFMQRMLHLLNASR
ncbi:hypothetical protein [Paraburkholderia fungorum]|uniref:hypothetical protein n=1 Tax=Paraburkholderia fungorum TaxID=134537 RepID=UPI000480B89E|nr:hypothetical protein [Paraburkholderia fungorum]MBB5546393.1 hypothetical protein [Paraburkholderia fungorum]PNE52245.1 hypothetical protein A8H39_26250 [Paraburkholderia fungorum]